MNTVVRAKNLSKSYGKFKALDKVNFSIEKGSIVGLIGPNGAGKTTILSSLLGLSRFEGELEVLGINHCTLDYVFVCNDSAAMPTSGSSVYALNFQVDIWATLWEPAHLFTRWFSTAIFLLLYLMWTSPGCCQEPVKVWVLWMQ